MSCTDSIGCNGVVPMKGDISTVPVNMPSIISPIKVLPFTILLTFAGFCSILPEYRLDVQAQCLAHLVLVFGILR